MGPLDQKLPATVLDQYVKQAAENSAVLITGNPKFIEGNPKADAYYQAIEDYLKAQNYSITRDPGEPYTEPDPAKLWIGHSRGADRLRFAPEGTQTLAFGALGGVNHPDDTALKPGDVPTDAHYEFTDDMKQAILGLLAQKTASDDWYVGKSEVAGQGVFAGKDYEPGDRIGIAMTDGDEDEFGAKIWNLTELARYCNHQNNNNVDVVKDGDRFHLTAIKPIEQDDELVSNYWQVAKAKGPHSVMLWEGKPVPTSDLSDYVEKGAEYRLADQTFSDSDGSYNVADLYELAKAKGQPQDLKISDLLHNLDPSPEEEGEELPGHPDFVSRAEAAGDFPGVVVNYPDGKWVADGVHRLWKANRDKRLEFPAYMLNQKDLAKLRQKSAASRVRVVMPYGKGYLMEKLNNPKFPDNLGKIRFPGGGIDEGETAEEAAVREMQEELGLTVDPAMLKRLGIYADGQHGPEQYFSYDEHGLEPGDYEAAVGGDKHIELLEAGTDNPNFWGSKLDELQKEAAKKLKFVHSCCGKPSGKCPGCLGGSMLILKDEYEKTGNRPSRNKADS